MTMTARAARGSWCLPASYTPSPASAPACSDVGKTMTNTTKGWKWPDWETVDAADVAFWINTEKWEKTNITAKERI